MFFVSVVGPFGQFPLGLGQNGCPTNTIGITNDMQRHQTTKYHILTASTQVEVDFHAGYTKVYSFWVLDHFLYSQLKDQMLLEPSSNYEKKKFTRGKG